MANKQLERKIKDKKDTKKQKIKVKKTPHIPRNRWATSSHKLTFHYSCGFFGLSLSFIWWIFPLVLLNYLRLLGFLVMVDPISAPYHARYPPISLTQRKEKRTFATYSVLLVSLFNHDYAITCDAPISVSCINGTWEYFSPILFQFAYTSEYWVVINQLGTHLWAR